MRGLCEHNFDLASSTGSSTVLPVPRSTRSALTAQSERLGSAALSFQGLAVGRLDRSEAARFFHEILGL